ncbi:conjugal transfer protein TraD [Vibrio aerogenes]|uniref:conjugal transfer protein TraD n=1 Tax=Vibrio aerogenes TaxID=92172 RepID=UPI0021C3308A|nr:conjugal transfer protein TraD [Vibrio aerogenes]
MADEPELYASYHSLSRQPLIAGIPVITLVIGFALVLLTTVLALLTVGLTGLVVPALILFGLLYIRIRCAEDSRATEEMRWELKGMQIRLMCRSNMISFTSIDESERRRKEDVSEWIKNNTSDR